MDSSSRFALRAVVSAVLGGIVGYLSYSLLAMVVDDMTLTTVVAIVVGVGVAQQFSRSVVDRLEAMAS